MNVARGAQARQTAVMTNPDALAAIREYVLTGFIAIDLELLRGVGFPAREAEQLAAVNEVRELKKHYSFPEPLTLDNAERQLAEFNAEMQRRP